MSLVNVKMAKETIGKYHSIKVKNIVQSEIPGGNVKGSTLGPFLLLFRLIVCVCGA